MSEEILKALMQLFAIIAKQDGVVIKGHDNYVKDFLASQLSIERVQEYLKLYFEFFDEVKLEIKDDKDKARTSMKDSVRTLAICKKINKTLTQKQKLIVLMRLIEFFRNDSESSANRLQIVETVADVFKIEKQEFADIKDFILFDQNRTAPNAIIIGSEAYKENFEFRHYLSYTGYQGILKFHYVKSVNFIVLKYHGTSEHFLNGILIKPEAIYIFPQGSTLRLPQTTVYYSNIVSKFLEGETTENFSFNAHISEHVFPNGKKALHELRISETGGTLVGIMGASGSGKTTLLTLLSGQEKPTAGSIHINEYDLYKGNDELKGFIGFVPQDDLLIEDLTVYQNLYYNAKLCFADLADEELNLRIDRTLTSLGLDEIRAIKVGNALNKKISGGQRKRLNIALELIREPNILFLDEPTSGLSSRDSENVMDLLKELTIKGKLVFVVIHQPSSDIYKMFDKLMILDTGGYGAYYGNPIEGVMYFKKLTNQINCEVGECHSCGSVNPEMIFNLIELKEINEYGNYTDKRKITPQQFFEFYKDKFLAKLSAVNIKEKLESKFRVPGIFKQTKYFFLRDLFSKIANRQYIAINILEVPLLVTFLSLIIKYIDHSKGGVYSYYHNYNIPAYIFMSIIAALLVGLTISAEEIFKDQKILKREKFLHLSRFSYLMSKVGLLFGISLIHSLLYVVIGHSILGIHVNWFNFFLMMFSVFAFANILGLILSSSFNSPVTIYIIIPLIIIPQMLLGGAMFNYNKLSEFFGGGNRVPPLANVMVSRWAYEGLVVDMQTNNEFERDRFAYDRLESKFNYKIVYFIPKVEELLNSKDSLIKNYRAIIKSELEKDLETAIKMGYEGKRYTFDSRNEIEEYLKEIKGFYSQKLNLTSDMKEVYLESQAAKLGGKALLDVSKMNQVNSKLEEVATAALEIEKIVLKDDRIEQVIDPIYREPDLSARTTGFGTHFLSAKKFVFGCELGTYYYNLAFIWLMNILLFVVLQFNLLKRLLDRTTK